MSAQVSRRSFLGTTVTAAVGWAVAPAAMARVGPAPGIVRLSSNENPYGPSELALKAAAQASEMGAYYPGSISNDLQRAIALQNEVSLEHIVLSSGSNEALSAAVVAWGKFGTILAPALTYDLHMRYASRIGTKIQRVPLKPDMSIDLQAMEAAVDDSISMVYVCNPNNPTGMIIDGDELRDFCRTVGKKATVLIDEAYFELTDNPDYSSMIDLVRDDQNVIIMRTFSKIYGLAGMRVGYGMARPDLAKRVGDHVMAWPNIVGLAAAKASIEDAEFKAFSREKILEGRQMVNATFKRNGIQPLRSETNFVYADIGRNANEFQARMRKQNVHIHGSYEGFPNFSRVSMGKIEDLQIFADVFDEVYNG